jgi:hypothetical protein
MPDLAGLWGRANLSIHGGHPFLILQIRARHQEKRFQPNARMDAQRKGARNEKDTQTPGRGFQYLETPPA